MFSITSLDSEQGHMSSLWENVAATLSLFGSDIRSESGKERRWRIQNRKQWRMVQ